MLGTAHKAADKSDVRVFDSHGPLCPKYTHRVEGKIGRITLRLCPGRASLRPGRSQRFGRNIQFQTF